MKSTLFLGIIFFVSVLHVHGKTKLKNEELKFESKKEETKVREKRQATAPTTAPTGEQEIEIEETTAAPTTTTKAAPTLAPYPRPGRPQYQPPRAPAAPTIGTISYSRQQYLGKNPTNSQVWPGSRGGHAPPQQQAPPPPQPTSRQWPPRQSPTQWPGPSYQQPQSFSTRQRPPASLSFSASLGPRPTQNFQQRNDHLSSLSIGRSFSRPPRMPPNSFKTAVPVSTRSSPAQTNSIASIFGAPKPKPKVGSQCPTFLYTTQNNMVEFHTVPGQCKIAIEFPPPGFYGHPKVRYFAKAP